jgi:glycosyltransferase involved in cell wall biosynthesis
MGIISAERVFLFQYLPKGPTPVPNSISVLLPVQNAQATLAATVQEILDVAADLSERFEVLIIDDGSSDATSEVAAELTHDYPQVRAVRQGHSVGREEAIRSGMKQSRGDVVLLHEDQDGAPMEEILCLWRATSPGGRFFMPPQSRHGSGRQGSAASHTPAKRRGFKIIDRPFPGKSPGSSKPIKPNFLARLKDFAFSE